MVVLIRSSGELTVKISPQLITLESRLSWIEHWSRKSNTSSPSAHELFHHLDPLKFVFAKM